MVEKLYDAMEKEGNVHGGTFYDLLLSLPV